MYFETLLFADDEFVYINKTIKWDIHMKSNEYKKVA